MCDDRRTKSSPQFNARLIGTTLLCALGIWCAIGGRAHFQLGGDEYGKSPPIYVDARGIDAFAIGCLFISLGIINLAVGIGGPRRIPVFWTGAGVFIAVLLYGAWKVVADVIEFFTRPS